MDIKTLILALALGNLSLCAALFFFEYESRKSLTMSTWAVAKQLQTAAWLLLYFRGAISDLLTILLGNGLLFPGLALDASALWKAAGEPVWRRDLAHALLAAETLFVVCDGLELAANLRVPVP